MHNIFQQDYGHQTNHALVAYLVCLWISFCCLILNKDVWNVATMILIKNHTGDYRDLKILNKVTKETETESGRNGS